MRPSLGFHASSCSPGRRARPAGRLFCLLVALLVCGPARAQEEFIVSDIRVEGLERISAGTVFNYLPIQVGDQFDDSRSTEAVRALFKTGFFDDVRLERDGDVLVFIIEERPAVGSITITGNSDIETEDLLDSLTQVGFAEGEVFQKAMLERVERELREQYFSYGKYGAQVATSATPIEDNRVAISIDISEGTATRIKNINIVGNTVWEEDELLELLESSPPGWFSFFTKDDQYSRQRLGADLEILRSHYLDNGHLNFDVDSTQISITPDKKDIYITINITEGEKFSISGIQLAGTLILPEQELLELIDIEEGDVFSRRQIAEITTRMSDRLGEEGYAFANVNPIPDLDEENTTVSLTFFIDPGKRVYVRRINFLGNNRTRDEVLRREMRQQESAWASTSQIERGRLRLQRTGYFGDVSVETQAVVGTDDQVDVNYAVQEQPSGSLNFGLGFSQEQSFIFRASVSQNNFLGSGKFVSIAFNTSDVNQNYQIGYSNPYYTVDGISRGFNVFYRSTDAKQANISTYNTDEFGGAVNFGFPVSEHNTVHAAAEYSNTSLSETDAAGIVTRDFIAREGSKFNLLTLTSSFRYDTRNKAILPDAGLLAQIEGKLSTPFFGNSLEYYKLDMRGRWFKDVYKDFILSVGGEMGYGDGYADTESLPFFQNFYAGGPNSLRGYRANTLGPKDDLDKPVGGEFKLLGNLELLLPLPFLKALQNSVRVTTFLDAGNVYQADGIDLGETRYTVGLGGIWISPFGQISVSIAQPLNDQTGDSLQQFQFNFGTGF